MIDFKLPEVGENITSGQAVKIAVQKGVSVKKDQTLLELETEKATIEVPSPADGTIAEILIHEGDTINVGQVVMKIDDGASSTTQPTQLTQLTQPLNSTQPLNPTQSVQPTQPLNTQSAQIETMEADVPASPTVRRFARELGVQISNVPGTGPEGLITKEDVKAYTKHILTSLQAGSLLSSSVQGEPLPDFSKWGSVERKPLSNIRKKTSSHLAHAWATIPHVTQFGKADITELEELRKKYSTPDHKLTLTPFIMRVVAAALKQFPQFNASLDTAGNEIIYKKYTHIGVAVDTENGLLVPVIRDVDQKSITQLSKELTTLAQKARDKKLGLDDMKGGCFTITNLGGLGASYFTPIVNWPEVAILGVCRAAMKTDFRDGVCHPRLMLPLSLSYDHRVIDGADGARFMKWMCDAIEQPFLLELN